MIVLCNLNISVKIFFFFYFTITIKLMSQPHHVIVFRLAEEIWILLKFKLLLSQMESMESRFWLYFIQIILVSFPALLQLKDR